jgi:hypothetical protein
VDFWGKPSTRHRLPMQLAAGIAQYDDVQVLVTPAGGQLLHLDPDF